MRIETKYEIGQEIFVLVPNGEIDSGIIAEIQIHKDRLFYVTEKSLVDGWWAHLERNCFPTLASAQAEAEKRNGQQEDR